MPQFVPKKVTHFGHVHSLQITLQVFQKSDSNPEDGPPPLNNEHVKYLTHEIKGQKTGKKCHKPFGGEIFWCHLNLSQMFEKVWHVKLNQLCYLEILEMQFGYSWQKQRFHFLDN